jgi:arylformamidase
MAMKIHDISMPLRPGVPVWPGDAVYEHLWTSRRSDGATVNVSQVRLSVHTGTHTDAPLHFIDGATAAAALPLEPYFGPARVVDVRGRPRIGRADLQGIELTGTPRVLFRTDAWLDQSRFPDAIPVMDADVPEVLAESGVVLVGLDVPSVDALASHDLPVHHALAARGICILESLALAHIPAGVYWLIALPLPLQGADGAPVRAALWEDFPSASRLGLFFVES